MVTLIRLPSGRGLNLERLFAWQETECLAPHLPFPPLPVDLANYLPAVRLEFRFPDPYEETFFGPDRLALLAYFEAQTA